MFEREGFDSFTRKAQRYVRDLVREAVAAINTHTTAELERHMATISEALDRLTTAISTEIQQVRDGLAATIAGLTDENAALAADLQAQVDALGGAQTRIESMAGDLEANDPPAEPPVDPPA